MMAVINPDKPTFRFLEICAAILQRVRDSRQQRPRGMRAYYTGMVIKENF